MSTEKEHEPSEPEMNRRKIKMEDGRYLFFYTFETSLAASESLQRDNPEKGTDE
jgi:hypothetical protein